MSQTDDDIVLCFACGNPMSVAGLPPYTRVACPTCGEENRIKKKFGPYTVTKRHAIGGMSSVFAGIDVTLNREVALKILSEEYSKDEKRIAAFEDEARLTASFSHPHVVKILTTGRAFGLFYIAMEFVPGGHLEHRIYSEGKITEAEMLPLAIQIAEGLKGAQAAGLIHRDIKPGNILFDAEGNAKIVDFGLALVTKGGEAKAEEIWATPFYVPPEAIEGGVEDFRSDIYAFGATLFHALAGVPSCTEDSMDTKLLRIAKTKVIPLKRVAPEISYETCAIVDRAMSYDPRNRYRSYDEMIIALQGAIKALENGGGQLAAAAHAQAHAILRMQLREKKKRALITTIVSSIVGILVVVLLIILVKGNDDDKPSVIDTGHSHVDNADNSKVIASQYSNAKSLMNQGKFKEAEAAFNKLFSDQKVEEPTRSWAGIDALVSALLDGRQGDSIKNAKLVNDHLEKNASILPTGFSAVMSPALRSLDRIEFQDIKKVNINKIDDENMMVCMLYGLKNWEQGGLDQAVPFFEKITSSVDATNNSSLAWYRKIAVNYLDDYKLLKSSSISSFPSTQNQCTAAIDQLNIISHQLKTRGRAKYNISARQTELRQHEKYLKKLLSPE
jgi:eukaryotic-like serine/threonine-protein kinase